MSELLRKLAAHIRTSQGSDYHVASAREFADDESPSFASAAEPKVMPSTPVEPAGTVIAVGEPRIGRLAYFSDGIERKATPCFVSMVPLVYGYTAAAIRIRGADRRMRCLTHSVSEALYMPYSLVAPDQLQRAGMVTSDTAEEGKALEEHPMMLLDAAKKRISGDRDRLEAALATRWLAEFAAGADWLLVDGSLTGDYAAQDSPNMIGVIKSHQTQYFPWDEQQKVLGLRVGERSGVFIPGGRKRQEVYSWYLRMHPNAGRDLYFGLVRVEAPKSERTLEMADEISRWLLAERSPLSLPDSRWDKMLYPIYDCEQFLKSRAPTRTVIEAAMAGLGA